MSSISFFCFTTGILLCLFVGPIWSATTDDTDDYVPYEGQRYDSFDWNLLKALETPEFGNVLVSPLSIKLVLAMLYEGATGATEKQLEGILQLPVSRQATRDRFQQILNSLQTSSSEHTLDIGSRVYMDSSIEPQQRFAAMLKMFYDTDIKSVDFNNVSETEEDINYWASNITHGRVKNLVSEGDLQDAVLLMANALYFKGLWRIPFPRNQTRHGGFYITPSRTVTVPYMYTYGRFYYFESNELDAKILRLPYKGTHMSMFILLPNSKAGLSRLINDISPQVLKRHLWLMDQHYVHVHLPKFAFEFNSKLGRILQKLGLHHIFQNTASLAGIARGKGVPKKLMVSNILQKAGIEINEEGSTVWAATEVALGNKFGTPDVSFNASNPFVFYIEDEFTGSVIFVGKIENPTQIEQLPFPDELKVPTRFAPNPESESASTPDLVAASTTESQTNPINLDLYSKPSNDDLKSERFFYFDIDLLKEIANAQPQGNFLISPLSIKSTLLMVLEGSASESAVELKSALRLPENNKYIRDQFQKLLEEFSNPKSGVTLVMSNTVFISDRLKPVQKYRSLLAKYYASDILPVDFKNGMTSAFTINNWVCQHTHGLISELVNAEFFGGQTSILLANALYFKGIWEKSFNEQNTQPRCFYLSNNECYMTPMMDTVNVYKYDEVKELDAQVIELPYTGGEYSMIIVLPNKRHGVLQLVRDIRTSINSIAEKLNETEVLVALPRFKIDFNGDIKDYLQNVHVQKIFSPQAILSGIVGDDSARVSNFIHKTTIEVNEKGTVAAAASGAVVIPLMGNVKPTFRADHPFLFFIRHIPSGTILFEGRVSEPERATVNNAVATESSSSQYRLPTSNGPNGINPNLFLGQHIQNLNIQRNNFQVQQ